MKSRLDLHNKLLGLMDPKHQNVYYQPPESLKMDYPCIRYTVSDIDSKYANNKKYINNKRYLLTVISGKPDDPVIEKILELPLSSFDRHYVSDNLNHDVIELFF